MSPIPCSPYVGLFGARCVNFEMSCLFVCCYEEISMKCYSWRLFQASMKTFMPKASTLEIGLRRSFSLLWLTKQLDYYGRDCAFEFCLRRYAKGNERIVCRGMALHLVLLHIKSLCRVPARVQEPKGSSLLGNSTLQIFAWYYGYILKHFVCPDFIWHKWPGYLAFGCLSRVLEWLCMGWKGWYQLAALSPACKMVLKSLLLRLCSHIDHISYSNCCVIVELWLTSATSL